VIVSIRSSRPFLAVHGPKALRRTTLVFRLARNARLVFTITQVSPTCSVVGSFTVPGHKGVNKVPFRGRFRGRQLPAGTYEVSARTRGGEDVLRLTIVVVDSGVPSPMQLAEARSSNVCAARAALASGLSNGFGIVGGAAGSNAEIVRNQKQGLPSTSGDDHAGSALGVFSPSEVSKNARNPLVIAALAAAALLLALAALPREALPDPRLNDALARHRVEVAVAGAGAFVAGLAALLLG
jgi:hypothetical protein